MMILGLEESSVLSCERRPTPCPSTEISSRAFTPVDRNRSPRKRCRDPLKDALEKCTALVIGLHLDATPDFAERYDGYGDKAD